MSKEPKQQDARAAKEALEALENHGAGPMPWAQGLGHHGHGHGFEGPVRSKVKGGAHTKAELKRAGTPQGDRIGERSKGLS
ncbi:hypothetical protein DEJ50_13775 [Streptomyces venezuelae]|uniref:Uncharacterized protein n=1 Tax=Streptomyces venezuelae TaxID=54571 RepID=A0A5P2D1V0_STRVZ|nr:hypothetical protein [Streptomyces venezuelae]QES48733.1 hypothetical protein DEJ50_13775 [Streptomyces venezuelae]